MDAMNTRDHFSSFHARVTKVFITVVLVFASIASENCRAGEADTTQQPVISLDAAVNTVRNQYADGKILKTTEERTEAGKVYVIKLITADSRVIHIRVDAQSGRIIK